MITFVECVREISVKFFGVVAEDFTFRDSVSSKAEEFRVLFKWFNIQ